MTEAPAAATPAAPAATTAAEEKKPAQRTTYTILRKHTPEKTPEPPSQAVATPDLWEVVGMEIAGSSDHSIRSYAAKQDDPSGVYVAVPARSWTEKTVQTETKTQLRLG